MANRAILKTLLRILIIFLLNLIVPVFVFADNGKILFHNFEKDVPWIYSINADGTDLKKIIKKGLYPLWSPNRKMIAYSSPTSLVKDTESNLNIFISDSNGKVLFKVEPIKTKIAGEIKQDLPCYYAWSPDGKKLAIVSILLRFSYIRIYDIEAKQVKNSYKSKLKNFDLAYLWSSVEWLDNTRLLFVNGSPEKPEEILKIIDVVSNIIKGLKHNKTSFYRYWFKKGILAISPEEKGTEFWLLDEKGNEKEKLLQSDSVFVPVTKVVNNKLLLQGGKPGDRVRKLYLFDLTKNEINDINIPGDYQLFSLVLSPDGNKFVCVGVKNGMKEAGYYIFDILTEQLTLLKKITIEIDQSYWKSLYFGLNIRDCSWR